MKQSEKSATVPFHSEFLTYLHQQGFKVGIEHHVWFQTLLTRLGEKWSPDDLKTLLCPLVATSESEQQQFYREFDIFFERVGTPQPGSHVVSPRQLEPFTQSQAPTEEPKPVTKTSNMQYGLVWIIAIGLISVLVPLVINGLVDSTNIENLIPPIELPVQTATPTQPQVITLPDQPQPTPTPAPVIYSVNPTSGVTDTENIVEIRGENFIGSVEIFFGYDPGKHVGVVNETVITVSTPRYPASDSVDVTVTAAGGRSQPFKSFTYVTPPAPSLLEKALQQARYLAFAVFAALLFLIGSELYGRLRQRKILREQLTKKPPVVWPIEVKPPKLPFFGSPDLHRAARLLRRRQVSDELRLDIPATIIATIKSLRYPRFLYRPTVKFPEYLILIERVSFFDHQAQLFQTLAEALGRENLYVTYYFFDDPRVCCDATGEQYTYLADLEIKHAGDRLLIFSDGHKLLDPVTGQLQTWISLLQCWKEKAILTPVDSSEWGGAEEILASEFIVVPAEIDGLASMAESFEGEALSKPRMLTHERVAIRPTDFDHPDDVIKKLRGYLGEDVFQWLCACAIYPELQWDLTLHLGVALSRDETLLEEENLLRLMSLPWFRSGSMPDNLRNSLLQQLDKKTEKLARSKVLQLMHSNPPNEQHSGTLAERAYQLNLVSQRWLLTHDSATLEDVLQLPELAQRLKSLPNTFLNAILARTGIPGVIRYKHGIPVFGLQTGVRLLLVTFMVGLVFIFYLLLQTVGSAVSSPDDNTNSATQSTVNSNQLPNSNQSFNSNNTNVANTNADEMAKASVNTNNQNRNANTNVRADNSNTATAGNANSTDIASRPPIPNVAPTITPPPCAPLRIFQCPTEPVAEGAELELIGWIQARVPEAPPTYQWTVEPNAVSSSKTGSKLVIGTKGFAGKVITVQLNVPDLPCAGGNTCVVRVIANEPTPDSGRVHLSVTTKAEDFVSAPPALDIRGVPIKTENVHVTVRTFDYRGNEVSGLRIYYATQLVYIKEGRDIKRVSGRPFPDLSSPASIVLGPGIFVMWAINPADDTVVSDPVSVRVAVNP